MCPKKRKKKKKETDKESLPHKTQKRKVRGKIEKHKTLPHGPKITNQNPLMARAPHAPMRSGWWAMSGRNCFPSVRDCWVWHSLLILILPHGRSFQFHQQNKPVSPHAQGGGAWSGSTEGRPTLTLPYITIFLSFSFSHFFCPYFFFPLIKALSKTNSSSEKPGRQSVSVHQTSPGRVMETGPSPRLSPAKCH